MKVRVSIKNLREAEAAASALDVVVGPEDTVHELKERVAVAAPVPLAQQELLLNDVALNDAQTLSACGVKDMDSLVLRFKATEEGFAKQLAGVLKGKAMLPEELALMYSHSQGITVREALGCLGRPDEKLQDFLGRQKGFSFDGAVVKYTEPAVQPAPAAVASQVVLLKVCVSIILRIAGCPDDDFDELELALNAKGTVADAKARIACQAMVPFTDCDLVVQGQVLENQAQVGDCAIRDGARLVLLVRASEEALVHQLKEILLARTALSPDQLSLQYCLKKGCSLNQAIRMLGLLETPRAFIERHAAFCVEGGCVRLASHGSDPNFALVARFVAEATSFLNVHSITEGKQSEVILSLKGLPPACEAAWMPGLLRTVSASLESQLSSAKPAGIAGISGTQDAVKVLLDGGCAMTTRLVAA